MSFPPLAKVVPGIALAAIVGLLSIGVAAAETRAFGHPIVEGLVVAILLGMVIRTLWTPPARIEPGIQFTAKELLEVAVLLLGASVDLPLLARAGPALAAGIVLLVVIGLSVSFVIGRALGLPPKLAILVACGNAICGNSAIAAVAPVIHAEKEHVASSIAFTAILGVIVVVGLPFLIAPLGLSHYQYGVLAGLTVYAVPQVLAAAFPVSVLSGQVGTLVKLLRVLMLGPVVLFFALRTRHEQRQTPGASSPGVTSPGASSPGATSPDATSRVSLTRFVPWFIIGFLLLGLLRSAGAIPTSAVAPLKSLSTWLTVAAMAALGLGVDLRAIRRVGRPVVLTVSASLILLVTLSIGLIHLLSIQ
jgi:uncharacterized integral membrane protein (TIGR00698 family)